MRRSTVLDLVAAGLLLWDPFWRLLGVKAVTPTALRRSLAGDDAGSPRPLMLDVRTRREFDLFHIPGALHRPDLLLHPDHLEEDRRRPLVVLCMTGHRSSPAAYGLKRQGFADVSSLVAGMLGYLLSGGTVVSTGTAGIAGGRFTAAAPPPERFSADAAGEAGEAGEAGYAARQAAACAESLQEAARLSPR